MPLHSVAQRDEPVARLRPRESGIIGSCAPWAMKMGTSRLAGAASAGELVGQRQRARQRRDPTQPLGTPEPRVKRHRPALREPEQKRRRRRHAALPLALDQRPDLPLRLAHPRLVLLPLSPARLMSYHARITIPLLTATGRMGAWGNTNRIATSSGKSISGTIGSKSCPSAPNPCNQITEARADDPVSTSTVSRVSLIQESSEGGPRAHAEQWVVKCMNRGGEPEWWLRL